MIRQPGGQWPISRRPASARAPVSNANSEDLPAPFLPTITRSPVHDKFSAIQQHFHATAQGQPAARTQAELLGAQKLVRRFSGYPHTGDNCGKAASKSRSGRSPARSRRRAYWEPPARMRRTRSMPSSPPASARCVHGGHSCGSTSMEPLFIRRIADDDVVLARGQGVEQIAVQVQPVLQTVAATLRRATARRPTHPPHPRGRRKAMADRGWPGSPNRCTCPARFPRRLRVLHPGREPLVQQFGDGERGTMTRLSIKKR